MSSIPKKVLEITAPQLYFINQMGPEFAFMLSKFIETYLVVLKEGRVGSLEELVSETIERFEEIDHPFFD